MVAHLAEGKRVGEIARSLGTSADSVYEHLEKIRRRLGARTNAQLIHLAIHHGFLGATLESSQ
jgi:DNA-binding CsgD family transcriptional regulator